MNHVGVRVCLTLVCLTLSASLSAVDDPLIAMVDTTPIRMSDVYRRIEQLPLGDQVAVREQVQRFADSVVREELLFQYALSQVLAKDAVLRDRVKALVVEPLATHADCERLLPQISDEESFSALAKEHGTDPELTLAGGDMGYVMLHQDVLGLGTLVHQLPLHKPFMFDNQDGCHLIWMSENLQPPMPALENVAVRLQAFLEGREEGLLLRRLVDAAAASVPVTRFSLEDE